MSATAAHQDSDADSLRTYVASATGVDVSNVKNLVIVSTTSRRSLTSGQNSAADSAAMDVVLPSRESVHQVSCRLTTYTWDVSFSVTSDSSVTSADSLATSVNQALSDASFTSTVTNGISSATSLSVTAVVALTRKPTLSPIPLPTRQPSPVPSLSLHEPPLPTASDPEATSIALFGIMGAGGALALCLVCSGLFQLWKCVRKRPANAGDDPTKKKKRTSKEEKKAIEAERKAKLAPRGTYRATASFREAQEVESKDASKKSSKNKKELKPQMSLADYTNFKPLEDISKKHESSSSSSSDDDDGSNSSEEEDVLSALENTGSKSKKKRFGKMIRSESKDDGYGSDDSDGNSSVSSKASSVRSDVSSLSALAKKHSSFSQNSHNNKKGGQSFLLSRQSSTQSSVGGPRTSDPDQDDSGSLFGADDLDEMVGQIAESTGISRSPSFNTGAGGGVSRGSSFNTSAMGGGVSRGSSFNTMGSRMSRSSSSISDLAGDDDDGPKITAAQIRAARLSKNTLASVPESDSGQDSGSAPSSSPAPPPPPHGFVRHEVAQSALNELVDLRKQLGAKNATNNASSGASATTAAATSSSGASNSTPRHPETPLEHAWDKVLTVAERDLNLWGRNMEVLFMSLDWEGNTLIDVAELCGSLAQHGVAPFTPEEQEAFRVDINPRFHAGTITCTEFGNSVKKRFEFEKTAVNRKAEQAKVADAKQAEQSKENAKRDSIKDKAVQRRKEKEAALAKLKEEAAVEEAAEQAALDAVSAKLNASKGTTKKDAEKDTDAQEKEEKPATVATESEPQSPEQDEQEEEETKEGENEEKEKQEEEKEEDTTQEDGGEEKKPSEHKEGEEGSHPKKGPAKRRASTAALEALKAPVVEEYHAGQEGQGLSLEVGAYISVNISLYMRFQCRCCTEEQQRLFLGCLPSLLL